MSDSQIKEKNQDKIFCLPVMGGAGAGRAKSRGAGKQKFKKRDGSDLLLKEIQASISGFRMRASISIESASTNTCVHI